MLMTLYKGNILSSAGDQIHSFDYVLQSSAIKLYTHP